MPDRLHAVKSLFPSDQFQDDAKRCGGFTAMAAHAHVALSQVLQWPKPGGATPMASTLERLLDSNGIDRSPYEAYLVQARPEVAVVCPDCGEERCKRRGDVTHALHRRRKGVLPPPRWLPDGRFEQLCRTCASRRILEEGYFNLDEFNESVPAAFVPEEDRWAFATDEDDPALAKAKREYPDPDERGTRRAEIRRRAWRTVFNTRDAKRIAETVDEIGGRTLKEVETAARKREREKYEKVRRNASAAKSGAHKRNIGVAHLLLGRVIHLKLCLLCRLLVHGPKRRWHKTCWMRWLHLCRRNRIDPSTPPQTWRGRPADENVNRDYRFLLRRLAGMGPQEILEASRQEIAAYGNRRRSGERMGAATTITKAIERFPRSLPGSWDLVFSPGGYRIPVGQDRSYVGAAARAATAAQHHRATEKVESGQRHWMTAKEERERRRQANQYLQERFPLPARLQRVIESGARDSLIALLHVVRMRDEEINELTGAGMERVKTVIAGPLGAEVAAQLTAWLKQRAAVATS